MTLNVQHRWTSTPKLKKFGGQPGKMWFTIPKNFKPLTDSARPDHLFSRTQAHPSRYACGFSFFVTTNPDEPLPLARLIVYP